MIKTTKEFPLKEEYWYILDFRKFLLPKLMPVYFDSKQSAKRVLAANIPKRTIKSFTILKGETILQEHIPYRVAFGHYLRRGGKYRYPKESINWQARKSFRTLMRRRLRRMKLLTNVKVKARYDGKFSFVKYIENTQKVAMNKNSDAKVFQIDDKPKKYFYILIKKSMSEKARRLFKLRCIRIDIKTGSYNTMILHTKRNTLFIPYLLEELKQMKNVQTGIEAYERAKKKIL